MNIICSMVISSIKSYLFGEQGIVENIGDMPPYYFEFRYTKDEDKNLFFELFKPKEVFHDINDWGIYTKKYIKVAENEGCAIISLVEDFDLDEEYVILCIYENNGEGEVNSFKFKLNDMIQEDVTGYEWFDLHKEYETTFGLRFN